jgi:hypothetical protein
VLPVSAMHLSACIAQTGAKQTFFLRDCAVPQVRITTWNSRHLEPELFTVHHFDDFLRIHQNLYTKVPKVKRMDNRIFFSMDWVANT